MDVSADWTPSLPCRWNGRWSARHSQVKHLYFKKNAGKKPDVDVVFDGIVFGGDLKFLESCGASFRSTASAIHRS